MYRPFQGPSTHSLCLGFLNHHQAPLQVNTLLVLAHEQASSTHPYTLLMEWNQIGKRTCKTFPLALLSFEEEVP